MLNPKQLGAIILAILMTASAQAAEGAPADATADMPMMNSKMMSMMHPMGQGSGHSQAGCDHHGKHAMGGGMGYMMMYPQMMQMRMQHMHNMEQQLKKIEVLLQQLVDQGKSGYMLAAMAPARSAPEPASPGPNGKASRR